MASTKRTTVYSEPDSFLPKELRKKYEIGEFSNGKKKTEAKKTPKKESK